VLERIGPYTLSNPVGRGGLGIVYRALDTRTGAVVALKLLHRPDEDAVSAKRMAREFRALRGLQHPNVVRVLDAGTFDGLPFLVMELVEGLPLRSWLDATYDEPREALLQAAERPAPAEASVDEPATVSGDVESDPPWGADAEPDSVPSHLRVRPGHAVDGRVEALPAPVRAGLNRPARVRKLRSAMLQLAEALAFVHGHGLVHRDLKPSNVIVADGGVVKLLDFGLVKSSDGSGTTAAGRMVGTFRYMSPEQARGEEVDARSDLFSLGGVLYEMMCGRPAFADRQTAALLGAIVNKDPPAPEELNPEVDRGLAAIAKRLLRKDPGARFASAGSVAAALRA
jgi:serine/threonine protein kinase